MRRSHQMARPRALLVLERRILRLHLLDQVRDVGGVGLPEQRHGGSGGNRARKREVYRRGPGRQATTRRRCWPSREKVVRLADDPARQVVEARRADLERRKAHRDRLEAVEVDDLEVDPGGVVVGQKADAADEIGDELEALLDEAAVLRVADDLALVAGAALAQARLQLLDLGREVLRQRDALAGLGGEVEDDVVEDLGVAQLLQPRIGAEIAEAELVEGGLAVEAPDSPSTPAAGRSAAARACSGSATPPGRRSR